MDVMLRTKLTHTYSEDTGLVANPNGFSEIEVNQCVEENKGRWYHSLPVFPLFFFPPHYHVLSIRVIVHLINCMPPGKLFGSLVSLSLSVGWEFLQSKTQIPLAAPPWPGSFSTAVHLALTSQLR